MTTRCFQKDKNLVTRSIAGETIIVPVRSGVSDMEHIHVLNEVGSRVWDLLDERTPISQIVDAICAEYEVSPEQAARDIDELLHNLETAALIHPTGASKG
jgi:Coenzyme PQQ synthesis protein D (PqqD)